MDNAHITNLHNVITSEDENIAVSKENFSSETLLTLPGGLSYRGDAGDYVVFENCNDSAFFL